MHQSSLPPLVLGIAGFGTVASGFLQILAENKEMLFARTGREMQVKTIVVRDMQRTRTLSMPEGTTLSTRLDDLVEDPAIDVVLELIGGTDAAKDLIVKALQAGKHVVTANKALLASDGDMLFQLAAENNCYLGYEASVCGGIPVIQTLRESLAGNRIVSLTGILNGTCNYILSEMSHKGSSFNEVLKEAQALGYAEADPTLDVEGFDAAHKLSLLIRLAWGMYYPYTDMAVRGVSGVNAIDIAFAKQFGCRIKLLGQARMIAGRVEASVAPALVKESFLLAQVEGPFNAVHIEGNAVGALFLHGRGAGDLPTGSAVASDVVAIAKQTKPNNTGYCAPELPVPAVVLPSEDIHNQFYMRLGLRDSPGVLRDVAGIMADNNISIAEASQKVCAGEICYEEKGVVPFVIFTHDTSWKNMENALDQLKKLPVVHGEPVYYKAFL